MKNNPDKFLSSQDILDLMPEGQTGRKDLKDNISRTLNFLREQNYLELKNFNHEKMTEVNLTDSQRIVLIELLEMLYRFQDKDPEILRKGRDLAEKIMSNPQVASNLMRRARESSSNANKRPKSETQGDILSILYSYPQGLTNKEMLDILKKQYGRIFKENNLMGMTSSLEKQGSVRVEKHGSFKRFFPVSNS